MINHPYRLITVETIMTSPSPVKPANENIDKSLTHKLLLVNGVNLNLLGKREPEIYGHTTLADIEKRLIARAAQYGIELICVQSNHEGKLVDEIQHHGLLADKAAQVDAIIINPAAFTHTSVALRDALLATQKPFIEVHLSNVHARESFRQHSYLSDVAVGVICGLGHLGYQMALTYWLDNLYSITLEG
jgi:3-dehydroquinate dehydratase-2